MKKAILITVITIQFLFVSSNKNFASDLSAPHPGRNLGGLYQYVLEPSMEEAAVLKKGERQFSLEYDRVEGNLAASNDSWVIDLGADYHRVLLGMKYGVKDNFEMGLFIPYVSWDGNLYILHNTTSWFNERNIDAGLGDVIFALKYQLQKRPDLSLEFMNKFPTGREQDYRGSGNNDYGIKLNYSTLLSQTSLHLNVGYIIPGNLELFPETVSLKKFYFYGISLNFLLTDKLHAITQLTGNTSLTNIWEAEFEKDFQLFSLGLTYSLNEFSCIRVTSSFGLTNSSPDHAMYIGFSKIFAGLKETTRTVEQITKSDRSVIEDEHLSRMEEIKELIKKLKHEDENLSRMEKIKSLIDELNFVENHDEQ